MISNGYLNFALQKAISRNINGTIEHNQLLQEIIAHACRNNKTLYKTFFELKDTFGSIGHEHIEHCLSRYHIPENVKSYINSLYSQINGTVIGPGGNARDSHLSKVFSREIPCYQQYFSVFNPILEYLIAEEKYGYQLIPK